jgi:beta-1,4-mannosyltransferase
VIRVLSYPPRHPYVDRLHGASATLVHRDQPWPLLPELYDPVWVAEHAADWDLAHLHFTWEQHPIARVGAVLDGHRAAGRPVVWTAHDLRNPHTEAGDEDEVYLACLADQADAVTTLTPGAATEVARRFGREAQVLPHGPLLEREPAAELRARPRPEGPTRVLLHAKSLRRNLDVVGALEATARAIATGVAVVLVVSVHDEAAVRTAVAELTRHDRSGLELSWHAPWTHAELCRAIADVDALLLPYRWGTHSGLVELAADVGTPVIASDAGYVGQQVPVRSVPLVGNRVDVPELAAALRDAAAGELPAPPPLDARDAARDRFLTGHRELYASLTT